MKQKYDQQELHEFNTSSSKSYGFRNLIRNYCRLGNEMKMNTKEKSILYGGPLVGALSPIALNRLYFGKSESLLEEVLYWTVSAIGASPFSLFGTIAGGGVGISLSTVLRTERQRRELDV